MESKIKKTELLAPAGDYNKLRTALHFGADAVYVGGNNYGLRQKSKNFTDKELKSAVQYCHERGKKIYVTVNIVAHNSDFNGLETYLKFLDDIGADGLIIADLGVFALAARVVKRAELHVSTQANVTNKYAALEWCRLGAKRIVLARELSLDEIREIREYIPKEVQLEAFVHGAMCISHSGRCLISNFLMHRDGNRGECVQACRWEYMIHEKSRPDNPIELNEDARGTYIMNSKDLNMLSHLSDLISAGVYSMKIEGRMKTQYYVATVTNAYRRAIDTAENDVEMLNLLEEELLKTKHRSYTTGFYYKECDSVSLNDSQTDGDYEFVAEVMGYDERLKSIIVMQRNRFSANDELEILSSDDAYFNKTFKPGVMLNVDGRPVEDAKIVCEVLYIRSEMRLKEFDILRRKKQI